MRRNAQSIIASSWSTRLDSIGEVTNSTDLRCMIIRHRISAEYALIDIAWIGRTQRGQTRCSAIMRNGRRCTNACPAGGNGGFCFVHRRHPSSNLHPNNIQRVRQERQQRIHRNTLITLAHIREQRQLERQIQEQKQQERNSKLQECKQMWDKAKSQHQDPIESLVQIANSDPTRLSAGTDNKHAVIIACFHDQYAEWKKRQPDYEPEVCSICFEPCDDDPAYQSCGHAYHESCIARWKNHQVNAKCPAGRCTMLTIWK